MRESTFLTLSPYANATTQVFTLVLSTKKKVFTLVLPFSPPQSEGNYIILLKYIKCVLSHLTEDVGLTN
jgi:hypothetical protein